MTCVIGTHRRWTILLLAVVILGCQKQATTPSSVDATGEAPVGTEPASNLNLNLTETVLSRDTVPAGEKVKVEVVTKNASGAKTSFKNVRVQLNLRGGSSLGTFSEVVASGNGVYTAEFTARRAGTPAQLEVLINGTAPEGQPPKITVVPGPASREQSLVLVSQTQVKAGASARVAFKAQDSLGNQLSSGGLNVSFALNGGTSQGQFGPVTDHQDGTYSAEFTALVAGGPAPVLAKIGGENVTSPLPAITVTPGPFSPLMTQISVPTTQVKSGEGIEISITAKDAYGNRLLEGGQTFQVALSEGSSTGTFGPVRDLGNGMYVATFTGWTAGSPTRITAISTGQTVGTSALIHVTAGNHDPSRSSIACAASKITLGGSFVCTLTLKDQYENLTTVETLPIFALTDGTSGGEFAPAQSSTPGIYTSVFTAKKDGSPTRVIAAVGDRPATSASPLLEVLFPSLTHSSLLLETTQIGSGKNTSIRFQARDANGVDIAAEGLTVTFTPANAQSNTPPAAGTSTAEIGAVQDRGAGLYVANVTGVRAGSPIPITAQINGRAFAGTPPSLTVTAGELAHLFIETAADGSGRTIGAQELDDGQSLRAHLVGRDAADNFVAELKASSWSLSDARFGSLSQNSGSSTEFFANRAATNEAGVRIRAFYPGPPALTAESGVLRTRNLPSSIQGLVRWYRASSFYPVAANHAAIGDTKNLPWPDSAASGDGTEGSSQRRPRYLAEGVSGKPAVRFCSASPGCTDSVADRIRIDWSTGDSPESESDITVFAVAARETGGTNAILSSQNKQHGLFLGWSDDAQFKFGFGSKRGSFFVGKVPAFAQAAWELITATLDRDEDDRNTQLSVFLNGSILAEDETRGSGDASEQKSENHGNSHPADSDSASGSGSASNGLVITQLGQDVKGLQIGDVLIYKRVLSSDERCTIQSYLAKVYQLTLADPCK
ncbi:MAG: Ig-like domain-containing protein [Bdellovibrionaceae bacterium]|nr:Ig-like domain-containing protein [Pseudobdellovibrionaceae bacterium]